MKDSGVPGGQPTVMFTEAFKSAFEKLAKKDRKIGENFAAVAKLITTDPEAGKLWENKIWQARMKGNQRGKRGGYRVLYKFKKSAKGGLRLAFVWIYPRKENDYIDAKKLKSILGREAVEDWLIDESQEADGDGESSDSPRMAGANNPSSSRAPSHRWSAPALLPHAPNDPREVLGSRVPCVGRVA